MRCKGNYCSEEAHKDGFYEGLCLECSVGERVFRKMKNLNKQKEVKEHSKNI